ncbi:MAG: triose-phosphate isomerase [Promethearchaeota archaeon]
MGKKFIIGGNWKMNKNIKESEEFAGKFLGLIGDSYKKVEIIIFPTFISVPYVANKFKDSGIFTGGQNMYFQDKGAFTGEISPSMLLDAGATHVILGHSERRKYFGESNDLIAQKLQKAHDSGLKPILCIGETKEERENGLMESVLKEQLTNSLKLIDDKQMKETVIAYEPVWAIGTGLTATPEQAQSAHEYIRKVLASIFNEKTAEKVRIQYGGSIKPKNAKDLFSKPDIDGGLVGGASLDPDSFIQIINSV